MTYTVTFGRDGATRDFTRKDDAINFLRNLGITVCGEVRDSAGTQWAVRQGWGTYHEAKRAAREGDNLHIRQEK